MVRFGLDMCVVFSTLAVAMVAGRAVADDRAEGQEQEARVTLNEAADTPRSGATLAGSALHEFSADFENGTGDVSVTRATASITRGSRWAKTAGCPWR